MEFTARAELSEKIEKARELLSHAIPSGDLGELFERALDALLEKESRKRFGAGKPRKARKLKEGSRHVPVEVARAVWERDGGQCTFVDAQGRRCGERRFVTIEHSIPFALGGPPTPENLCLLCRAHNLESARRVFGEPHIEARLADATPPSASQTNARALSSLCHLGFNPHEAAAAVTEALASEPTLNLEQLLRQCLLLLVPKAS